jgi:hypothetical protein
MKAVTLLLIITIPFMIATIAAAVLPLALAMRHEHELHLGELAELEHHEAEERERYLPTAA